MSCSHGIFLPSRPLSLVDPYLLCRSVISDKRHGKLHSHSTKPVLRVLESQAGGIGCQVCNDKIWKQIDALGCNGII